MSRQSRPQPRPAILVLAAAFCLLMLGSTAIGIVNNYDLTPFSDMWDGVINFYLHAHDWNAWFDQHGEHRLVLSRLLFWADTRWFGGRSILLLAANYVLAAALAASLCRIFLDLADETERPQATRGERLVLCLLLTGWVFQWSQSENFVWGFQNQFFLVLITPLWGFYLLARAARRPSDGGAFALACASGFAALGAMANGVLVLPLMTAYAAAARMRAWRVAVLAALAALGLVLFFHHYHGASERSPFGMVLHDPVGVARFALLYLGSPWLHGFGNQALASTVALLAALALVARSAQLVAAEALGPRRDPARLALLGFIAFVAASATTTAAGRLQFGLGQALASRYHTPAIMAWAAFAAIHGPLLIATARRRPWIARTVVGLLCLMLLGQQGAALKRQTNVRFDRAVAGLALELGVRDEPQIKTIFPYDRIYDEADQARRAGISMFAAYPYAGLRERLGAMASPPAAACLGATTEVSLVSGDNRFVRVSGWLAGPAGKPPRRIAILDSERRVVGYALTEDDPAGPKRAARFTGYARAGAMVGTLTLAGDHPDCSLAGPAPATKPIVP